VTNTTPTCRPQPKTTCRLLSLLVALWLTYLMKNALILAWKKIQAPSSFHFWLFIHSCHIVQNTTDSGSIVCGRSFFNGLGAPNTIFISGYISIEKSLNSLAFWQHPEHKLHLAQRLSGITSVLIIPCTCCVHWPIYMMNCGPATMICSHWHGQYPVHRPYHQAHCIIGSAAYVGHNLN